MTPAQLLEPRTLFASAFANINVSRTPGNHAEGTIVVDPTDPSRLFAASNAPGVGLLASVSADGGATWTSRQIAAGDPPPPGENIAPACCDPSAAFDRFGNLFLTYARDADHGVQLVRSTDGGASFSEVADFEGDLDQPTVTAGPDSVWLTFKRGNAVAAVGAAVTALGSTLNFGTPVNLRGSGRGNFGDVAVGPQGQVAVTYQQGLKLAVHVDPDGLGPAPFGRRVIATTMKVSGFDRIAAQRERGIDAEGDLLYAPAATGVGAGRLYLLYTDEQPDGSDNTDVVLRYSADGGATWTPPMRVNSDPGLSSQFLPRMEADDQTGDLYFAWYDTRDDAGPGSPADTDGVPNNDSELFVARARPTATGMTFAADAQVSQGSSNPQSSDSSVELGDYIGLAYRDGTLYPLWADNSNSTGDNPDGAYDTFDQYTARVPVASLPDFTRSALATTPQFQAVYTPGRGTTLGGKPDYRFRVTYASPIGVDPATIDDNDILVTGPAGFSAGARLLSVRPNRRGGGFVATYSVAAPTGRWTRDHNGTYSVAVQPGQISSPGGLGTTGGGMVGWFVVKTGLPPR